MSGQKASKQNVTVSLDRETMHKAKITAARRSTLINGSWARQIASLLDEDEACERAKRQAMATSDQGVPAGWQLQDQPRRIA